MKKVVSIFILLTILTASAINANVLFESRTTQVIAPGVTYERNRMMTTRGQVDLSVLKIDINHPHISIEPIISSQVIGRRDTTLNMVRDSGAIAGINADFFNMSGRYTTQFGPMAADGRVTSAQSWINHNGYQFGTFLLDDSNNSFFRYLQTTMRFFYNGNNYIRISALNSIGPTLRFPAAVDSISMSSTAAIDARIPRLTKVVVENGVISHISEPGETVNVPSNGFVILIPNDLRSEHINRFNVGQTARFEVDSNLRVDFTRIQAAVSGGGIIMVNGEMPANIGTVPTGRHPRSIIGATADGTIILMAIDGRSHSIGATPAEMVEILRHYGVVNAINLDGGGSTAMVVRNRDGNLRVANTPSDGSMRAVINSIGVFNNAPIGEMIRFNVLADNRAVVSVPTTITAYGEDGHFNRLDLARRELPLTFETVSGSGTWEGNRFTPDQSGFHTIRASYGTWSAESTIRAFLLGELQITPGQVTLFEGENQRLSFMGIALDGTPVRISQVNELRVEPSELGRFVGNVFHAQRGGTGYISASIGNVSAYIPVTIGGFGEPVNMPVSATGFFVYPSDLVTAGLTIDYLNGSPVFRLDYTFSHSNLTQAAYLVFDPPLPISENADALRLTVDSDGSGHWIRGRLRDENGRIQLIDFIRNADFIGEAELIANIPATGTFTIDQIYMVTLNTYNASNNTTVFIGLEQIFIPEHPGGIPQGSIFADPLRAAPGFTGVPGAYTFSLQIPRSGERVTYSYSLHANLNLIRINTVGGGISAGGREQWSSFMYDARRGDPPFVVFFMNTNPQEFRDRGEFELFHTAMTELLDEDRIVFVVSATGTGTTLHIRDGVRYINIEEPPDTNAAITFWMTDDVIMWRD